MILKLGAGEKVKRRGRDHHREEVWQQVPLIIQMVVIFFSKAEKLVGSLKKDFHILKNYK